MDNKLIDAINKQIYRKFPEVDGVKPVSSPRPGEQVLLVYKGAAITADGRAISRTVRVVVDQAGKILKMTTSK
jgi:hypothetical protein